MSHQKQWMWQWDNIFKVLKEKKHYQYRILYSIKLFFKNEDEIKTFPHNQKLGKSVAGRSDLQEILKEVLQVESK